MFGFNKDKNEPNSNDKPASKSEQMPVKYKFKELKIYSSDEWMADGTKKYRKVYDRYETTYMRAELSFYNKLFDEEQWDVSVRMKSFYLNGSTKTELSNQEYKRTIMPEENIVYIRDGWGNATPGGFWFKGDYVWEAYINDIKIGEAQFHIEDVGPVKQGENPYFDIESIKLFEGDGQAASLPQKKYLTHFSREQTRFIFSEFNFKNKTAKDYYVEIIANFYDDAGQPKGRHSCLKYVAANTVGQVYTVYPGWGSELGNTWKDDKYTVEFIFMDVLQAVVPFEVGTEFKEGGVVAITDAQKILKSSIGTSAISDDANKSPEQLLEESLAELNALTGMQKVKKDISELVKLVRFYQETGKDVINKFSLHTVFMGNPGTGKTTVARILAKIYRALGILEKGHLVEVDREGLVAGYVGQTAIKTGDKIKEAMGGILFIDEAYSLASGKGGQYDFGGEAIEIILKRMEDMRGKFAVIVAGYTDNMNQFITSNPGLKSRFDRNFIFEDYVAEELFVIAQALFVKEEIQPDQQAAEHLRSYFNFLHDNRDKYFGNARSVRQVVGEAVKNQNLRLASMKKEERTKEMLETLILDDVKDFVVGEINTRSGVGFKFGEGK